MPDIVLKDKNGNDITYPNIDTVTFDTPTEGEQVTYSYGVVEQKSLALDMASGNQVVNADDGKLFSQVTIEKPIDLIASNIKKDIDIGGIVGEFIGNEEEATVTLNMANGNQEVFPSNDKLLSKVTIKKPETLLPENIAEGIDIGGVVGTFKGGSEDPFDDPNFKYFTCSIDSTSRTITLLSILYDVIYEDTGSYDVNIPDKIGGLDVIIQA